jgi:hypothetical protein
MMTPKIKEELNLLADMMLMVEGYKSCLHNNPKGTLYDCSTSTTLRCQKAWNQAVTAYAFLNKKPDILKLQVKMSTQNMFDTA